MSAVKFTLITQNISYQKTIVCSFYIREMTLVQHSSILWLSPVGSLMNYGVYFNVPGIRYTMCCCGTVISSDKTTQTELEQFIARINTIAKKDSSWSKPSLRQFP